MKMKYLMPLFLFSAILFAKENGYKVNKEVSIQQNNERPVVIENSNQYVPQSREEIDLIVEDFESGAEGWNLGSGWQIVDGEYGASETHSINSPNDDSTLNGTYDLMSPVWSLPALGDGETMNFDFWIFG